LKDLIKTKDTKRNMRIKTILN